MNVQVFLGQYLRRVDFLMDDLYLVDMLMITFSRVPSTGEERKPGELVFVRSFSCTAVPQFQSSVNGELSLSAGFGQLCTGPGHL